MPGKGTRINHKRGNFGPMGKLSDGSDNYKASQLHGKDKKRRDLLEQHKGGELTQTELRYRLLVLDEEA